MNYLLQRNLELDRQLAGLVGKHIDKQAKSLRELRSVSNEINQANEQRLLTGSRPGTLEELSAMTVKDLRGVAAKLRLKGRSKPKRKSELVAFLIEHRAPALPSYEQLLDYYLNNS